MKYFFLIFTSLLIFSCGNEKVLQLPEINHSEITDIKDVSHAYLFYDETQADSVELNRKNLISTTNWLINVDKRLTLKQAIPHIKYLQDKKANSSHKKEGTKNYYTCNDTSRRNLGFVEFTDVVYHLQSIDYEVQNPKKDENINQFSLVFHGASRIGIKNLIKDLTTKNSNKDHIKEDLKILFGSQENQIELLLKFKETISFQDYVSLKSILLNTDLKNISIAKDEIIFN